MYIRNLVGPTFEKRLPNGSDIEESVKYNSLGHKIEIRKIKDNFNEKDNPQHVESDETYTEDGRIEHYHHIYEYSNDGFDGKNIHKNLLTYILNKSIYEDNSEKPRYTSNSKMTYDNNSELKTRESHSVSYMDKKNKDIIEINDYFYDTQTGECKDVVIRKAPDGDVEFMHKEERQANKKETLVTRYYRNYDGSAVKERWTEGSLDGRTYETYNKYKISGNDIKYDTSFSHVDVKIESF